MNYVASDSESRGHPVTKTPHEREIRTSAGYRSRPNEITSPNIDNYFQPNPGLNPIPPLYDKDDPGKRVLADL